MTFSQKVLQIWLTSSWATSLFLAAFLITNFVAFAFVSYAAWDHDAERQTVPRSGRGFCRTAASKLLQQSQCVHSQARSCCRCTESTNHGINIIFSEIIFLWYYGCLNSSLKHNVTFFSNRRVNTSLPLLPSSSLLCRQFLLHNLPPPTPGLVCHLLLKYCRPVQPALPWGLPTPNILLRLQVWRRFNCILLI